MQDHSMKFLHNPFVKLKPPLLKKFQGWLLQTARLLLSVPCNKQQIQKSSVEEIEVSLKGGKVQDLQPFNKKYKPWKTRMGGKYLSNIKPINGWKSMATKIKLRCARATLWIQI